MIKPKSASRAQKLFGNCVEFNQLIALEDISICDGEFKLHTSMHSNSPLGHWVTDDDGDIHTQQNSTELHIYCTPHPSINEYNDNNLETHILSSSSPSISVGLSSAAATNIQTLN